jgi:hypothetical protein
VYVVFAVEVKHCTIGRPGYIEDSSFILLKDKPIFALRTPFLTPDQFGTFNTPTQQAETLELETSRKNISTCSAKC